MKQIYKITLNFVLMGIHTSLYRTWWIYLCGRVYDCVVSNSCVQQFVWVSLTRISVDKKSAKKLTKNKFFFQQNVWLFDAQGERNIKEKKKKNHKRNEAFSCHYVLSEMWWTMICILYARSAFNNDDMREKKLTNQQKNEEEENIYICIYATEVPADYPKSLTEKAFAHSPLQWYNRNNKWNAQAWARTFVTGFHIFKFICWMFVFGRNFACSTKQMISLAIYSKMHIKYLHIFKQSKKLEKKKEFIITEWQYDGQYLQRTCYKKKLHARWKKNIREQLKLNFNSFPCSSLRCLSEQRSFWETKNSGDEPF